MEDGDDEVEPHQHIQIPQRSGVIVEIENECPNLRDSHFQGEGGHVYGRIVCRGDVIQINEIQYRQHVRVYHPESGTTEVLSMETANQMFGAAGYDFICCVPV